MAQIFETVDCDLVNKKDPLFGWTSAHFALESCMYNELDKIVEVGGNFLIENNKGNSAKELLESECDDECDNREKQSKLNELLNKIRKKIEEKKKEPQSLVWTEPPMHKACRKNKSSKLFIYHLIGGHWGAQNVEGVNVQLQFLQDLEKEIDPFPLDKCNFLVKWCLANNRDHYGRSIIHYAAGDGKIKSLQILIDCHANVNIRKLEKGKTPIHSAAKYLQTDAIRILLEAGADIDATCFVKKSALHVAIERSSFKKTAADGNGKSSLTKETAADGKRSSGLTKEATACGNCNSELTKETAADGTGNDNFALDAVNILLAENADPNIQSVNGCTPLHFAAMLGRGDILKVLIENKGGKCCKFKFFTEGIHSFDYL